MDKLSLATLNTQTLQNFIQNYGSERVGTAGQTIKEKATELLNLLTQKAEETPDQRTGQIKSTALTLINAINNAIRT